MNAPSFTDRPFAPPAKAMVVIELSGEPRGKARPRFSKSGHTYTPEKTRNYEAALRIEAQHAMAGAKPFEGPVRVTMTALFSVPQSWSQKKQAAALLGIDRPTKKPDWDNIAKLTDALNGVVWRDDRQVVCGSITKRYSDAPMLHIMVEAI